MLINKRTRNDENKVVPAYELEEIGQDGNKRICHGLNDTELTSCRHVDDDDVISALLPTDGDNHSGYYYGGNLVDSEVHCDNHIPTSKNNHDYLSDIMMFYLPQNPSVSDTNETHSFQYTNDEVNRNISGLSHAKGINNYMRAPVLDPNITISNQIPQVRLHGNNNADGVADDKIISSVTVEQKEVLELLETLPECQIADQWSANFEALRRYCRQYGTCNCPLKTTFRLTDGGVVRLGRWLDKQRQKYRTNKLLTQRKLLLQSLADVNLFKWRVFTVGSIDEAWTLMYDALLYYYEHNQNYDVPLNYTCALQKEGESDQILKLGLWLQAQRQHKKLGKLRSDREELLSSCPNFSWDPSKPYQMCGGSHFVQATTHDDNKWMIYFVELIRYCQEHGHCNVPQAKQVVTSNGKELNLGQWLNKQRKDKRLGVMLSEREFRLQKLVDEGKLKWNMNSNS